MESLRGPAIEVEGLTRRFGDLVAVDRLDLRVEAGTVFGLLGSNGAGKSTTIKMLTTLLPPTSGNARVVGFDVVRSARAVRQHIGYVPQLLSADASLTGRENLRLSAALHGVSRGERDERVRDALTFMDLDRVGDALVKTYSGGMIRRLEIAQSMLHRPSVLFLDEPTVGLDPVARRTVWERLRQLRDRMHTCVLLTTHDMEEAEALCERVAIMHAGRIVAEGTPAALEKAVGPEASLEDVFVKRTGGYVEEGGGYRDVARARRVIQRLG